MRASKIAAVVAIAGMAGLTLGGCAEFERATGIGTKGQIGGVGGATVGGLIAAAAGAHPAWIAGSIILGALTGGTIGTLLDQRDKEQHAQSGYRAFEGKKTGGRTNWKNAKSGNQGTTQIDRTYWRNGKRCKDFTQKIIADGRGHTVTGTACKQADGSWRVMEG